MKIINIVYLLLGIVGLWIQLLKSIVDGLMYYCRMQFFGHIIKFKINLLFAPQYVR